MALLSLLMALLLIGCASARSGASFPTLKDTDVRVSWRMTRYRNETLAGRVRLGEREQVNALKPPSGHLVANR